MNNRKLASLVLALMLTCTAFASCNKNESDSSDSQPINQADTEAGTKNNDVPELSDNSTVQAPDSESTLQNEPIDSIDEAIVQQPQFTNKLTGLETTEELSNQRPVAIMFNNLKAALPQHGISEMDVVYEAIVEGSITRLLGIATDWESLTTLGSIRSSRDYYIDFSDAHGAIYVHAGGSDIAYQTLWSRGTDNIDGTNGPYVSSKAFYRNQERRNKGVSLEHTLFTTGQNLTSAISGNNYKTTLSESFVSPFKFSNNAADFVGEDANYVYIPFSTYAQSYFDFDTDTGVYNKGQYVSSKSSLDKHDSPHIDGNNNAQLKFENIVIIYTSYRTIDDKGRQAVNFTGKGTGYYFTDGKCKEIIWERPSRTGGYTLYEKDGTAELLMNPGKTYVGVIKNGTEITYK